jgi:hypothetical protein
MLRVFFACVYVTRLRIKVLLDDPSVGWENMGKESSDGATGDISIATRTRPVA